MMRCKTVMLAVSLAGISACRASHPQQLHHVAAETAASLIPRLHFSFGSDELGAEARAALDQNVTWLSAHAHEVLILEGHCDEHGDELLNLELGDRRARSVKRYLVAQGIDPDRTIMIVSFGEEKPLERGHSQEAWRMNRRVEFIVR